MKFTINKFKTYLSVACVAGALLSCSEDKMDSINRDQDNPHNVQAKYMLTDVITETAFSNIGADFDYYFASYVEHEVGIFNQLYYAENRQQEVKASATFNNVWMNLYMTLKNARIIIDKCSEEGEEAGNYTTKGMAEVMAALNSALLTDAFGDVPFSQAALPHLVDGKPAYMTPKIDKQQEIYTAIMKYLDDAIADLPKGDNATSGEAGGQDVLFGGDYEQWVKLAYALKARYTMHLLNVTDNKQQALKDVIDFCEKAGAKNFEAKSFSFAQYDGATNINPFFDLFYSRDYLAASPSLTQKLLDRNDPRLKRAIVSPVTKDDKGAQYVNQESISKIEYGKGFMPKNGEPAQEQGYYQTSIFCLASDAPTHLVSSHELYFLMAEAYCRLGQLDEAKEALKYGYIDGLLNMEASVTSAKNNGAGVKVVGNGSEAVTETSAIASFDANVAPRFDADPLKEIMIQKYIAFWGANGETTECYNDVRRLKAEGKDFYDLANPGKFPLRAPYGQDEVTANPEVKEAYGNGEYVFSENIWWAGGNR